MIDARRSSVRAGRSHLTVMLYGFLARYSRSWGFWLRLPRHLAEVVHEPGLLRAPLEQRHPGRAFPVLPDDDLCYVAPMRVLVVLPVPLHHDHDVGVRFEIPTLAQIGHHWALILPRLNRTVQAGHSDYRDTKLLGD